ncbi:MAG: hypothetical protein PUK40_01670, partial [Actinomycetaceae bacterium]|nr:hypothetical protein [Actinomycetaceae bacterium]
TARQGEVRGLALVTELGVPVRNRVTDTARQGEVRGLAKDRRARLGDLIVGALLALPAAAVTLVVQPGIMGSVLLGIVLCVAIDISGTVSSFATRGIGGALGFTAGMLVWHTLAWIVIDRDDVLYIEVFGMGVWLAITAAVCLVVVVICALVEAQRVKKRR